MMGCFLAQRTLNHIHHNCQHNTCIILIALIQIFESATAPVQAGIASGALASAAVGATNVLGTLIATGLIEGAGRKQLLTASYLGMATTMALMAAGFGLPALAQYR